MVEALREELNRGQEVTSAPGTDVKNDKPMGKDGDPGFDTADTAYKLFFSKISETAEPSETASEYGKDKFFQIIRPVLERLMWQVEMTFRHCDSKLVTANISKIYVTGDVSTYRPLLSFVANRLGITADTVDPFPSDIPLSSDISKPVTPFERPPFLTALGIASSKDFFTPNFTFTHADKTKHALSQRINRIVFLIFLILISASVGISFWQRQLIRIKKAQAQTLQMQMDQSPSQFNKNQLIQKVAQYNNQMQRLEEMGDKYLGLAVIKELSELTPPDISFTALTAELSRTPQGKGQRQRHTVILDGVVSGDRYTLDASLAKYLLSLRKSPIFGKSTLEKSFIECHEGKEVLRFLARLELVGRSKK